MERHKAYIWWGSLSINEQNNYISKHPFFSNMSKKYFLIHETSIIQIYNYFNTVTTFTEAKKHGLKNLIPVHINKCRCANFFWDWNSDIKEWIKGCEIPEKLKKNV